MGGGIAAALAAHHCIALDTAVLVYFLEGHTRFGPVAEAALGAIQQGTVRAQLSVVALMELLVRPLALGRADVADEHEQALRQVPNLRIVPFDGRAYRRAAALRASYRLRPPDALLLGSALAEGATAYLTNDERLRIVSELTVILLGDFAPPQASAGSTATAR